MQTGESVMKKIKNILNKLQNMNKLQKLLLLIGLTFFVIGFIGNLVVTKGFSYGDLRQSQIAWLIVWGLSIVPFVGIFLFKDNE